MCVGDCGRQAPGDTKCVSRLSGPGPVAAGLHAGSSRVGRGAPAGAFLSTFSSSRGNTTRARRPRPTRHRATCARARAAGSCRALGPASPLNKRVRHHELNYSQIRLILGPKNTQKPHQNSRTGPTTGSDQAADTVLNCTHQLLSN